MSAIELLLLSSRLASLPLVLANRPRILSFVMFLWSDGKRLPVGQPLFANTDYHLLHPGKQFILDRIPVEGEYGDVKDG
jgi:hypothetical protein